MIVKDMLYVVRDSVLLSQLGMPVILFFVPFVLAMQHEAVKSFDKNSGLGFAIPYLHNGQMHDYMPDFIIRVNTEPERYVILEIKGYDPIKDVKKAAAERWVNAVNADGKFGTWTFAMAERPTDVSGILSAALG